jgi:AcrR family transcriptional regulator
MKRAQRKLSPRKAPRQSRSQATVTALLQAAARVLAQESLAGFNTNRVAEVAGVSIGSLYQYFPNKEALVTALIADAQQQLVVARLAVRQQFDNPVLAAALDHEEKRLPLDALLQGAQAALAEAFNALLAPHRAALPPDLPASAVRDCLVITRALVEAAAERARQPPRDLQARIVRALLGYLTVTPIH